MATRTEPFDRDFADEPAVRGVLHRPEGSARDGVVLTHGAGSDRESPLLVALADAFAQAGRLALRCDLPYRQSRPRGGPSPWRAACDREGLRRAIEALREIALGSMLLGGSSYGGRQASMLAAEEPTLVAGLLLLSYPLHPPGKPERLRVDHFPKLSAPILFAHGSKDPFGTLEEVRREIASLPGKTRLLAFDGRPHGLVTKRGGEQAARETAAEIVAAAETFFE
jgi:hypothetical protein